MEPNTTQLRLLSINYESGLNEHILYDYDDHSGEALDIITELPDSATFQITRINKSFVYHFETQEKQITKLNDRNENLTAMIKENSTLIRSYQQSMKTALAVLRTQSRIIADSRLDAEGTIESARKRICHMHIEQGNGLAIKALVEGHEAAVEEYGEYQEQISNLQKYQLDKLLGGNK